MPSWLVFCYTLCEKRGFFMKNYFQNVSVELKEYFKILSPEIPEWLEEFIDVPEMDRIAGISMFCGKDYSNSFGVRFPISNLDHSVGVALIIWNFTHNQKQTIAGLYHDIATPVFKHCIDFMNGDSETQESTEKQTFEILQKSAKIMSLLKRFNIKLEEICDYKVYPIADNETPKLAADRFEYHFTCGMSLSPVFSIDDIKRIYADVTVLKNEEGKDELGFKTKEICEEYVSKASMLWPLWADERNNVYMNFLGDVCKSMAKHGYLAVSDLYSLSEKQVIEKILNCPNTYISSKFKEFQETTNIFVSPIALDGKYCVKLKAKRRYINPLVQTKTGAKRIYDVSAIAKFKIDGYLNQKYDGFGCLEFDFHV